MIDVTEEPYEAFVRGVSGGTIELSDEVDSLSVVLPDPSEGRIMAVEVHVTGGDALSDSRHIQPRQAPAGWDGRLDAAMAYDLQVGENPAGFIGLTTINLGHVVTQYDYTVNDGSGTTVQDNSNSDPNFVHVRTFASSATISR